MSSKALPASAVDLEPALREVLGDALTPGDAAYAVDGRVPAFVATPHSGEELAAALAVASGVGAAVIPWGGGQHMALGNVPAHYDVALRTVKLDHVIEYEPADLTVTVEAGITFEALQAVLREHGQFLPIDALPNATIGGALAAGVSGPSRHAYGLPRDWLIGCRVAHADGSVSKGGGRVVKNVAGYDLPKLAVGSLGTLGVIVEATFKVAPLPAVQETLLMPHSFVEDAARAIIAADERGLALRAVALVDAGAALAGAAGLSEGGCLAAYWLAGTEEAVARTTRELGELANGEAQRLGGDASERWWARLTGRASVQATSVSLRVMLLPSSVAEFMAHVRDLGRNAGRAVRSIAFPTTGLVLSYMGEATAEQLSEFVRAARRQARDADGSLIVDAAPPEVKRAVDVWGDPGTSVELMRRLKQQFDPGGTLNPGRFLGGI